MKGLLVIPLAMALSACGSSDKDDATSDGFNIDIGGATISADADGNAVVKGDDGMEITTGGGKDVTLPMGLALPPDTTVTDNTDANLPGLGRQLQVSGETETGFSETLDHFRAQAKAAGMAIDNDGAGSGDYVIAASKHGGEGSFTVAVTPTEDGATFNLSVSTGKSLQGMMSGG